MVDNLVETLRTNNDIDVLVKLPHLSLLPLPHGKIRHLLRLADSNNFSKLLLSLGIYDATGEIFR